MRRSGSTTGWAFRCPNELKQLKNFDKFAQLQMLWKVPPLASLFLSMLLSLLMQPPSRKARFYCRKDNGGGKWLVLNVLLLQLFNIAISGVELAFISGVTR